jgi:hypothetical protein
MRRRFKEGFSKNSKKRETFETADGSIIPRKYPDLDLPVA